MTFNKLHVISIAIAALAASPTASALDYKNEKCSGNAGGFSLISFENKSGGNENDVAGKPLDQTTDENYKDNTALFLLSTNANLDCKISSDVSGIASISQTLIKGSDFDSYNELGNGEVWIGLRSDKLGALKWGRFGHKLQGLANYPYGDPLNAETANYNSTTYGSTRRTSIQYQSPSIKGFSGGVTFGGNADNRQTEVFGNYSIAGITFDGAAASSVQNSSYADNDNSQIPIKFKGTLRNTAYFLGARYDFSNGAQLRTGFKSSNFAFPTSATPGGTGVYLADGLLKTVTQVNSLVVSGSYPLPAGFTLNAAALRYFDTKTANRVAKYPNDGASIFKLGVSHSIPGDFNVALTFKLLKLDSDQAVPGSEFGAVNLNPNGGRNKLDLDGRLWVFNQQGSSPFEKNIKTVGLSISKSF
jgi:hypothetical protein